MRRMVFPLLSVFLFNVGQYKAVAQTSETLRVWMDDITITADGQTSTKLKVYQHDEQDYASFNMSFVVPEGIGIAQIKSGRGNNITYKNDIQLSERASESHTITANQPSSTLIKIACTTSEAENLYPTDMNNEPMDELFTIGLVASPDMINGTYTIELGDLNFGLIIDDDGNMADVKMAENPSFQLTITGGQDALTIPYTLSSAGVGTLCLPFDAEVPEGLTVHRATAVVDGRVKMEGLTSIVAGVPLIVTGTPGNYTFRGVPSVSETEFTEGVLTGVTAQRRLAEGYVLQTLGGVTGFYRVDAEQPVEMPAYRAWLNYAEASVKMVSLDWSTVVGGVGIQKDADYWYDLGGRRMKPSHSGVYVQPGKKRAKKSERRE